MKSPAPRDPLAAVTREQWFEMWVKLRLHTRKRYFWLSEKLGEDLDELTHRAILDTMSGKRRWPPIDSRNGEMRGDISLFSFLCEVVRSNASHIWEREKRRIPIDSLDSAGGTRGPDQKSIDNLLNAAARKYPHLVNRADIESTVIYNRITERMLELVAGDTEVYEIMKLWREEPGMKPSEIASKLGFNMPRMRAAQKRLRRLLKGFGERSGDV